MNLLTVGYVLIGKMPLPTVRKMSTHALMGVVSHEDMLAFRATSISGVHVPSLGKQHSALVLYLQFLCTQLPPIWTHKYAGVAPLVAVFISFLSNKSFLVLLTFLR